MHKNQRETGNNSGEFHVLISSIHDFLQLPNSDFFSKMNFSGTILKVPVVREREWVRPCAFQEHGRILPDRVNCPKPGVWVELLLFILELFGKGAKIKIVEATGYSSNHYTLNDSSVLGMLHNKQADVTLPYMILSYQRSRLLPYGQPYAYASVVYITKKEKHPIPQLDLRKLYPGFLLFSALLWLLLFYIRMLLLKIMKRRWTNAWLHKIDKRTSLAQNIVLAILLGCVSSHVVMVFNLPLRRAPINIQNINDLIEVLESGEYTATSMQGITIENILNPVNKANKTDILDRFIAAAKVNPPKIVQNSDEAMDFVLNSVGKRYVFVTESNILRTIQQSYCDLDYVEDKQAPLYLVTFFVVPKWRVITLLLQNQMHLIEQASDILMAKYSSKKICPDQEHPPDKFVISLGQIHLVFWSLLIALVAAAALLSSELLWHRCHWLEDVCQKFEMSVKCTMSKKKDIPRVC